MASLSHIPIFQYTIVLILIQTPPYISSYDYDRGCTNLISCGNITNIGFPFWGDNRPQECGHPRLHLLCEKDKSYITIKDVKYQVLEANPNEHTLKITRVDYLEGLCPSELVNTSFDTELFVYENKNLSLFYGCNVSQAFPCSSNGDLYVYPRFGSYVLPPFCKARVVVPVCPLWVDISDFNKIQTAIRDGFVVRWIEGVEECERCQKSRGVCFYNWNSHQTNCSYFLRDAETPPQSLELSPPPGSSSELNWRLKIVIGALAAVFGAATIFIAAICYYKGNQRRFGLKRIFMKRRKFVDSNVELFMQSYGSLAPKQYNYSEVKRITNSFRDKLGQGGYGVVYKAKLPDGCLVAVKVISESKGSGEEFINEVASISRTSHVNIVSLLGFCYEQEKRALIYEFMPNGSLDKFIYKSGSPNAICNLDWYTLYQIAIGIARGLEYLHRGCSTKILHLDIKPQNILLDEDFCPKISDFGLAKICQKKESIVSLLGARGTIGYIAPEVLSRTYGGVSHKSDVYSYGMLILEMIGGRKNYDSRGSHTSEMYFPDWIYKDLEQGNIPTHCVITTEEENEKVMNMTLVSLWCVQINPSDRPSMSKIVEMLEGPLESVPYPPKPVSSSPVMPPLQISDVSSSNIQETNSITTQKDASIQLNELSKSIKVNVL